MKYLQLLILIIIISNLVKGFKFGRNVKIEVKYKNENKKYTPDNVAMEVIHMNKSLFFCFLMELQFQNLINFLTGYEIETGKGEQKNCIIIPDHLCNKLLLTCYFISEKYKEIIIITFEKMDKFLLLGLNVKYFNTSQEMLKDEITGLNNIENIISESKINFIKEKQNVILSSPTLMNLKDGLYNLRNLFFSLKLLYEEVNKNVDTELNKLELFIESRFEKAEEYAKLDIPKACKKFFKDIMSPTSKLVILLKSGFGGHFVGSFIREKWADYVIILSDQIDLDQEEENLKSLFGLFLAKLLFENKYEKRLKEVYDCLDKADMVVTFKELKLFKNKSYRVEKALLSNIDQLKGFLSDIREFQNTFTELIGAITTGRRKRKFK
jgi:hypothetical protein